MEEMNLVEHWLRKDPTRWIAGALAGIFAGLVTLGFAMIVATLLGYEVWFPVKLFGTICLGPGATAVGPGTTAIIAGLVIFELGTMIFGIIYSHFMVTNLLSALLPLGVVWAIFSWIFLWNLFLPSFKAFYWARIPSGPVLGICLVYGLALTSVAFFDRALRTRA